MAVYETERLLLKTLDASSAKIVLDYFIRNKGFLEEWEPEREPGFYTVEYQAAVLAREKAVMDTGSMLKLWIFKKDEPARVIGSLSFSNIVRGAFQSCFMGYRLDGREINRGYMTEAVNKGVSVMFGDYKLHRVEANVMPRNPRSLRVLEKMGFINEGLSKDYLRINGKWEDHIHMVLLNDAY